MWWVIKSIIKIRPLINPKKSHNENEKGTFLNTFLFYFLHCTPYQWLNSLFWDTTFVIIVNFDYFYFSSMSYISWIATHTEKVWNRCNYCTGKKTHFLIIIYFVHFRNKVHKKFQQKYIGKYYVICMTFWLGIWLHWGRSLITFYFYGGGVWDFLR